MMRHIITTDIKETVKEQMSRSEAAVLTGECALYLFHGYKLQPKVIDIDVCDKSEKDKFNGELFKTRYTGDKKALRDTVVTDGIRIYSVNIQFKRLRNMYHTEKDVRELNAVMFMLHKYGNQISSDNIMALRSNIENDDTEKILYYLEKEESIKGRKEEFKRRLKNMYRALKLKYSVE